MRHHLTLVLTFVALEFAALALAVGGLSIVREAGYEWSINSWVVLAAFLVLIAALVSAALRPANPGNRFWPDILVGALLFTVLLVVPLFALLALHAVGVGSDDGQSTPFDEVFPDLLAIALTMGPAFGAVVGLLNWMFRRTFPFATRWLGGRGRSALPK